jgi:hypothetical protein
MRAEAATQSLSSAAVTPNLPSIFTERHRSFLAENGYVVVPTGIETEKLTAVVDVIWDFLGMDRAEPDDWYRPPLRAGGMVELYQHQALWDLRQHPRLYRIFRELHRTGRLVVSIDRVSMKPPVHPDHPDYAHPGFIHWDLDLDRLPEPGQEWVQGVVALTDTTEDQGGFQCVPSVFRQFPEMVASLTEDERRMRRPDVEKRGLKVEPIPCRASDLIIWDMRLLHGNGLNRSRRPRMAQYITMNPERLWDHDEEQRRKRIEAWRNRTGPGGPAFPGDPRGVEQERYRTAELTPLGRCLLGIEEWPADLA